MENIVSDQARLYRPDHTFALFEGSAAAKETDENRSNSHDENEDSSALVNMNSVVGLRRIKLSSLHNLQCTHLLQKIHEEWLVHQDPDPQTQPGTGENLGNMMSLSSSSDGLGLTNTKKLDRNKSHLQHPVKTPILTGRFLLYVTKSEQSTRRI